MAVEGTKALTATTLTLTFNALDFMAPGEYGYQIGGVEPRAAADFVRVSDGEAGITTVALDLPDMGDDVVYGLQGELLVGSPVHVSIPVRAGPSPPPVTSRSPPTLPPSLPVAPLPMHPPDSVSNCLNACMGVTCASVIMLPCAHLARAGCSCGSCCNSTYSAPPPNTCGPGTEWNDETQMCEISCSAVSDGRRKMAEGGRNPVDSQYFGVPVPT